MQDSPVKRRALERSLSADAEKDLGARQRVLSRPGGNLFQSRLGSSIMEESANSSRFSSPREPNGLPIARQGSTKFPKLEVGSHFHYNVVDTGKIQVTLYDETKTPGHSARLNHDHSSDDSSSIESTGGDTNFYLQIKSEYSPATWIIQRNMESLHNLDRQLHRCVFDRKYSLLPRISRDHFESPNNNVVRRDMHHDFRRTVYVYFHRFSIVADRNMISCATVLNWFEMDNRGNRMIASDSDAAINTPAIGAAHVIKSYTARAPDELSLQVGDIVSIIDKPPLNESTWWRGKKQFEVGFFPADCVEEIRSSSVPEGVARKISPASVRPVLRKRGKLIARLRAFFSARPERTRLKHSGIVKERVFGCDLSEHLLNSGHDVPLVLKFCTEVIETHGVIDGIYRLSGITSNIQRLRNEFDEDRVPAITEDIYVRDVHSISSLVKMYFRDLPNPLLTYQLYDKFEAAIKENDEHRLSRMLEVIQQLPPPHYRTCSFLMKHLARMASFRDKTCMTCRNLAIVWAPNLLRCKELEQQQCSVEALKNIGVQAVVTEFLITHADFLFTDGHVPTRHDNSVRRPARPKSLATSTPYSLLSLEEARERILLADAAALQQHPAQVYLDVGGGPAAIPPVYHTVIELPKGRKHKKNSTSAPRWRGILQRGSSTDTLPSKTSAHNIAGGTVTGGTATPVPSVTRGSVMQPRQLSQSEQILSACKHPTSDIVLEGDFRGSQHTKATAPPKPKRNIASKSESNQLRPRSIYTQECLSQELPASSLAVFSCDDNETFPQRSYSLGDDSYGFDRSCGMPHSVPIGPQMSAPVGRMKSAKRQSSPIEVAASFGSDLSDDVFTPKALSRERSLPPIGELSGNNLDEKDDSVDPLALTYVEFTSKRPSERRKFNADDRNQLDNCLAEKTEDVESDSDMEPLGGSREAMSDPDHHISDLCLDDVEDVDRNGGNPRETENPRHRRRFHSPTPCMPVYARCCGDPGGRRKISEPPPEKESESSFTGSAVETPLDDATDESDWHRGWSAGGGSISLEELTAYFLSNGNVNNCNNVNDRTFVSDDLDDSITGEDTTPSSRRSDSCFRSPRISPALKSPSLTVLTEEPLSENAVDFCTIVSKNITLFRSPELSPVMSDTDDTTTTTSNTTTDVTLDEDTELLSSNSDDGGRSTGADALLEYVSDPFHSAASCAEDVGRRHVTFAPSETLDGKSSSTVSGGEATENETLTETDISDVGKNKSGVNNEDRKATKSRSASTSCTDDVFADDDRSRFQERKEKSGRARTVSLGAAPARESSVKLLKSKFEPCDGNPESQKSATMIWSEPGVEFKPRRLPSCPADSTTKNASNVAEFSGPKYSSNVVRREKSAESRDISGNSNSIVEYLKDSDLPRYRPPSVTARISCFEPLMTGGNSTNGLLTENKRARLSSGGSLAPANDDPEKWKRKAENGDVPSGQSWSSVASKGTSARYHSPDGATPDLLALLNIPVVSAKSLPRVSERKRMFELDAATPPDGSRPARTSTPSARWSTHGFPGVCATSSEPAAHSGANFPTPKISSMDKENSFPGVCAVDYAVPAAAGSRRKLFNNARGVQDTASSAEETCTSIRKVSSPDDFTSDRRWPAKMEQFKGSSSGAHRAGIVASGSFAAISPAIHSTRLSIGSGKAF